MSDKSRTIILAIFIGIAVLAVIAFVKMNVSPVVPRVDPGNVSVLKKGTRGKITDRDGVVLAYGSGSKRMYRFGALFEPVLGYAWPGIGVAGIEARYGERLMTAKDVKVSYFKGNAEPPSLKTTLSTHVQAAADKALGARRGAVVVLDAATGEVWVQLSHPSVSPQALRKDWERLKDSTDSPLFDRASSASRYPPGSVMKITDALLLLKKGVTPFNCPGSIAVDGLVIRCAAPHGHVSGLAEMFSRSCNAGFIGHVMTDANADEFYRAARKLGFVVPDVVVKGGDRKRALAVIGQGGILLSPMQAARIAATVANDGMMPEPIYVKGEGKLERIIESQEAKLLGQLMEGVVKTGTGRALGDLTRRGARLGLKTGTAEIEGKIRPVDWAVGFYTLPGGKQRFSYCVVVEEAEGHASEVCLPIVRRVIGALQLKCDEKGGKPANVSATRPR